jgi:hypothetical protein
LNTAKHDNNIHHKACLVGERHPWGTTAATLVNQISVNHIDAVLSGSRFGECCMMVGGLVPYLFNVLGPWMSQWHQNDRCVAVCYQDQHRFICARACSNE